MTVQHDLIVGVNYKHNNSTFAFWLTPDSGKTQHKFSAGFSKRVYNVHDATIKAVINSLVIALRERQIQIGDTVHVHTQSVQFTETQTPYYKKLRKQLENVKMTAKLKLTYSKAYDTFPDSIYEVSSLAKRHR